MDDCVLPGPKYLYNYKKKNMISLFECEELGEVK